MKRLICVSVFAFAALYILTGEGTRALELGLAERFSVEEAIQTGESGKYTFDVSHTFIGFKVNHMGLIDVPGHFRSFSGEINYDAADVSKSSVTFSAKVESVDTGVEGRDKHLRSADFFEVEKFPEMTFKSTKVEKRGAGLVVSGDLTLKGVTKPVSIPFQISGWLPATQRAGMKMGITGETTINRRDFNVNYGNNLPSGIPSIGNDVKVQLAIEAMKARETQPAQ